MKVVLFSHPDFLSSQSMPRFARMIAEGMRQRGHTVDVWSPDPLFYRIPFGGFLKKWLGYIDQYVVFPLLVKAWLRRCAEGTLYVFADQALGPWVPLVADRPHVVHVHDFMALRSAQGEFDRKRTGWAGRQYQAMIRRGFILGRAFISVSKKTRDDLHRFVPHMPPVSEVVYNGLNFPFRRMSPLESSEMLGDRKVVLPPDGFLLHVGGNQWYKNREGVLALYAAYVRQEERPLPLWMVGPPPTDEMRNLGRQICETGRVEFLTDLSDEQVCAAYSSARLLIFPSLAEGFGWPIAEALACGCPVLTTGESPMTEVGGEAAFYLPVREDESHADWSEHGARQISEILSLPEAEIGYRRARGFRQVAKFKAAAALDAYERIYLRVQKASQ